MPIAPHRPTRFRDRVGVVTGAGSGIGLATATLLALEGAKVLLVDINQTSVEHAASEICSQGGTAKAVVADVGIEENVRQAIQQVASHWNGMHLLVSNAASFIQKGIDARREDWQAVWQTNLMGTVFFARYAYPCMRETGGGSIVIVSSVSGMAGESDSATYCSSKAALLNLTQCLAVDLGPHNIRVNAVSPGATVTPAMRKGMEREGISETELQTTWPKYQCLRRLCQPEDVAQAIGFLLSDEAACITGANLVVDGGYMAKKWSSAWWYS